MKIETKYNVGDKVWIVYEPTIREEEFKVYKLAGEVALYLDRIIEIVFYDNKIVYVFENCPEELEEYEIILYNEKDKLLAKIEELTNKIEERERNN